MIHLKSPREIALMRQAGLAVWRAHQIVGEMIRPGATTAEIDREVEKHFDARLEDPSSDKPLALSLDLRVQSILHDELAKSMEEFRAIGATGIITDIKTGEVIAMSSLPQFDPNKPGRADDNARFNRATLGVYEMGSTFKPLTAAAAETANAVNG